ncbi:unnamed protein product [Anisakis simplex]|uniref:Col_cuticle_N domain-containing protein n=1 Tax=Anisakis simplex TaxID=6269 RepID=A0A0M3JKR9_ANISI|nr:unnamed protein product [Anisakis simplex]
MDHSRSYNRRPGGSMKRSAFIAIILATFAIASCLMVFPLLFNYLQIFEGRVQIELETCKVCCVLVCNLNFLNILIVIFHCQ